MDLLNSAALGLTSGGAYALMALGIVAVFRGTGIVNFAQAAVGMFSTYIFWVLYQEHGLPLDASLPLGLLSGAAIGVVFSVIIGRRLLDMPVATRILITFGMTLALEAIVRLVWTNNQVFIGDFLVHGNVQLGDLSVSWLGILLLCAAVAAAGLLGLLFNRTAFGRVAAALQDSPVGAQSLGHSPARHGLVTWTIGGLLAAAAGILYAPVSQLSADSIGSLLIPGLGAALLARFRSFGIALIAAMAIGIFETVAGTLNLPSGFNEAIPYCVTLLAVVLGGRGLPDRGSAEARRLPRVGDGRISPLLLALGSAAALIALLTMSGPLVDPMTVSGIYALISLGIVVAVGYTGQVVLTPLVFVAIGMLVTVFASAKGAPMLAAILLGPLLVAVIGFLVAVPSVRVRGVGLTVGTIAFAASVEILVFTYEPFFNPPSGWQIKSDSMFGISFDDIAHPRALGILVWVVVVLTAVALARFRSGRAGRRLLATRADERGAAAAGISVRQAKVVAYVLSSVICALAGSLLVFQVQVIAQTALSGPFDDMTWQASLGLIAMLVFAGVGYLPGAVIAGLLASGGIVMVGLNFSPAVNNWISLVTAVNLVVVLAFQPDGSIGEFVKAIRKLRELPPVAAVLAPIAGRLPGRSREPLQAAPEADVGVLAPRAPIPAGRTALTVTGAGVHYGGVQAVADVTFELRPGRVVGVLGPNGAGKSSLVDAVTGFIPTDAGRVAIGDRDVTALPPHERVRLGLARTFQDNLLFEDLTVRENLQIGTDPQDRGAYVTGLVGLGRSTGHDEAVLQAAAALVGIGHLLGERVENLSLGWHARVTLARVLAARPAVLCLDEPAAALSAGARAEVSAVIRTAAHQLGIAVLLVEHNIDVVLDTCDELIVMDRGRVIARGNPGTVLALDEVRTAYLGDLSTEQVTAAAEEARNA